ncbi:hypothetical protein L226DRAFT_568998 [Lentinus tigrinus ALCF2SS1-7]|uniref:uncharacterized protein n=1 Tax=Lentinus tigrinus ALCF2SS1-7 TaxID=1328758 RepID=UPI001165DD0C|nr:hypothetical protein L226DRAFT_568998 [Lentinus tigrinus ALCF2SS1-7]
MADIPGDCDTAKDLLKLLQTELGIKAPSTLPLFSAGTPESRDATLNVTVSMNRRGPWHASTQGQQVPGPSPSSYESQSPSVPAGSSPGPAPAAEAGSPNHPDRTFIRYFRAFRGSGVEEDSDEFKNGTAWFQSKSQYPIPYPPDITKSPRLRTTNTDIAAKAMHNELSALVNTVKDPEVRKAFDTEMQSFLLPFHCLPLPSRKPLGTCLGSHQEEKIVPNAKLSSGPPPTSSSHSSMFFAPTLRLRSSDLHEETLRITAFNQSCYPRIYKETLVPGPPSRDDDMINYASISPSS